MLYNSRGRWTMTNTLVINSLDTVGWLSWTWPLASGSAPLGSGGSEDVITREAIPFGHKVALASHSQRRVGGQVRREHRSGQGRHRAWPARPRPQSAQRERERATMSNDTFLGYLPTRRHGGRAQPGGDHPLLRLRAARRHADRRARARRRAAGL